MLASAIVFTAALPGAASGSVEPVALRQAASCTDERGPGLPPPTRVALGLPGYHATWYGQSGYLVLCPGHETTAVVAFMNSGSLGWYADRAGEAALLGTSGPEPGRDRPSALGGTDIGWPSRDRPAAQPAPYIAPGQVAWFQFRIRAPQTPGTYRLYLRPVIEGKQWLEDQGVHWTVRVKADDSDPLAAPADEVPAPARTYWPAIASDGSRRFRVSALMFHYVGSLPADPDAVRRDLTVSPTDLAAMLGYLAANGYHTITAKELWWALDQGTPLPEKPVLLTFDDGYAGHYEVVLPLLRQYGMVGTFAVTANLIGRPGYMTREQVRALADAGMDVESHAADHVAVATLRYERQVYQLCTSRRLLSEWTGTDVRHFIYPSGVYLPLPAAALSACGYLSAYRKDGGSAQSSSYMYALRRARVRGQQGLGALLIALAQ